MSQEEDNKLIKERIAKLNELRGSGINPYPYSFKVTHHSDEVLKKYTHLKPEEKTSDSVSVAGRLMQIRRMGKASFAHLQDEAGRMQLYFREDDIGNAAYELLRKTDIGDIIGVNGKVFATKTGEVTVYVEKFELLCKSIRPLPEKYHGLKDTELRYRMRYLDLIMNQDVKETFKKRSMILSAVREFFHQRGYMEVETPALQIIYGGANARPFVTHINAWDMKMYLSISPETYLKRLVVGGFEKVFTICKNFRNEGVDKFHNPEFTMLESYQSWIDYNDVMKLVEECYEYVCKKINGSTKVKFMHDGQEIELDFKAPWKRMTMLEAIKIYAGIDAAHMDEGELKNTLRNYNVEYKADFSWGVGIQSLFEELVEDKLIQPIHITDHPKESTPLCKLHRKDPRLIERFESFCIGMELCNAYSELNDPIMQKRLLEEQAAMLRGGAEEAHPMDEDFIQSIEYGLPPTGGLGVGIDRMVILLTGSESIRDVILFPTMKPEAKTVDEQLETADAELKASLQPRKDEKREDKKDKKQDMRQEKPADRKQEKGQV